MGTDVGLIDAAGAAGVGTAERVLGTLDVVGREVESDDELLVDVTSVVGSDVDEGVMTVVVSADEVFDEAVFEIVSLVIALVLAELLVEV